VADINQFGSAKPPQTADAEHCAQCEAMLADALDGALSAADQATFDLHMVGCESCSAMLADARRGAAWMEMLKSPRPEPSSALLERILAQTSGKALAEARSHIVLGPTDHLRPPKPTTLLGRPTLLPSSVPAAAFGSAKVLPFRSRVAAAFNLRSMGHTLLQPRLAMTAAMAFFSIALTLNLMGVRLDSLRVADLKPSTLQMNIARQFYGAKKQMVSYYENIRFVYEVESKMRELRQDADSEQKTQPRRDEKQQPSPQGDGHKTGGRLQSPKNLMPPKTVIWGQPTLASLDRPIDGAASMPHDEKRVEVTVLAVKRKADQAERSLA